MLKLPCPEPQMCNLYSQTRSQDAMRHVFDPVLEADEALEDSAGSLPPMPGIYPGDTAPICAPAPAAGSSAPPAGACRLRHSSLRTAVQKLATVSAG